MVPSIEKTDRENRLFRIRLEADGNDQVTITYQHSTKFMNSNAFVGELEVCKMSMANAGLCFCMKKRVKQWKLHMCIIKNYQ